MISLQFLSHSLWPMWPMQTPRFRKHPGPSSLPRERVLAAWPHRARELSRLVDGAARMAAEAGENAKEDGNEDEEHRASPPRLPPIGRTSPSTALVGCFARVAGGVGRAFSLASRWASRGPLTLNYRGCSEDAEDALEGYRGNMEDEPPTSRGTHFQCSPGQSRSWYTHEVVRMALLKQLLM